MLEKTDARSELLIAPKQLRIARGGISTTEQAGLINLGATQGLAARAEHTAICDGSRDHQRFDFASNLTLGQPAPRRGSQKIHQYDQPTKAGATRAADGVSGNHVLREST